jgi:hypothetical protein
MAGIRQQRQRSGQDAADASATMKPPVKAAAISTRVLLLVSPWTVGVAMRMTVM